MGLTRHVWSVITSEMIQNDVKKDLTLALSYTPKRRNSLRLATLFTESDWLCDNEIDILRQVMLVSLAGKLDDKKCEFLKNITHLFCLVLDEYHVDVDLANKLSQSTIQLAIELYSFYDEEKEIHDNLFSIPNFHLLHHIGELCKELGNCRTYRVDLHERFIKNYTSKNHIHGNGSNSHQCASLMISEWHREELKIITNLETTNEQRNIASYHIGNKTLCTNSNTIKHLSEFVTIGEDNPHFYEVEKIKFTPAELQIKNSHSKEKLHLLQKRQRWNCLQILNTTKHMEIKFGLGWLTVCLYLRLEYA
jgi:hypothetical protein